MNDCCRHEAEHSDHREDSRPDGVRRRWRRLSVRRTPPCATCSLKPFLQPISIVIGFTHNSHLPLDRHRVAAAQHWRTNVVLALLRRSSLRHPAQSTEDAPDLVPRGTGQVVLLVLPVIRTVRLECFDAQLNRWVGGRQRLLPPSA
jgi:hypothetical protein